MTPLARRARFLPPAIALFAVPLLAAAHALPLHTALKRSEPAKDSRLAAAPTRVSLWFTAKPQLAFSRIRILAAAGDLALDSIVADTGNALHAIIPRPLGPGEYTVVWQTASADGHPIRGEFAFAVAGEPPVAAAPRGGDATTAAEVPAHLVSPKVRSEYRTARWMEFVALLTVLGALGFRHGVLPPLASRGVPTADAADRSRRLGQSALALYGVAAVIRLYTESAALSTPEDALEPGVLMPLLTTTTWGVGWLIGVVGACFLLAGWTLSKRNRVVGTPLALTGALGLVLSPALSGHAAASRSFVMSVTLDMLHVAAAGVWLGGLLMVLIAGIPAMRRLTDGNPDAAVSALVNSFHPMALVCAPIVVIAGMGTSWIRLGGLSALTSTEYGQTLIWKVLLFALVAAVGMYNALRARKRLGAEVGTVHLRRSAFIELSFAALVLAATTILVTTPVPSDMVVP